MLDRRQIQRRLEVGLNDLATIGRAMGVSKDMFGKAAHAIIGRRRLVDSLRTGEHCFSIN